ncbi:hypothetical protein [Jiangella gansuensis]|nr:hypothetical protein [Jiangella gansuensis]
MTTAILDYPPEAVHAVKEAEALVRSMYRRILREETARAER